ncbi:methionine--tRNA ligase [Patescibacteria group bacterium]|nr:methionine--tRNA ligase [Patescibacteria group bacterium]MBU4462128.1 methionine--tRNA ligase [Patescibacteria group bacterium]MCG2699763.1 methionine--tRNA ligase [Candidatus Parcubacteria bacterium]
MKKGSLISNKKKRFYITTPIYYVNSQPHLGHSYTTIAADVLARYHRLQKDEVFFLTGTDEHGAKIEKAAQKANKTPQQLCNENSKLFKKAWQNLNISYDNFIRTTNSNHIKSVRKVLQILYNKKLIYKGTYKGLYCLGCEQYKTKSDLINGKCPDHQIKPEIIKEENYFFKLSQFENLLRKKIMSNEFEIKPEERKREVLGFFKKGLKDISISRQKIKWGIPLPFDKKHTTFVWVDAFLNYLTGLEWNGNLKNLPKFWSPDLQLMSKDILRVHASIWPALLLALEIPLPKKLFIHGYFTIDGQKMSKSLGNVIRPEELVEKFGVDATRYLLLSACSFGKDGDISWEKLFEKYNTDLASGLGNLVARIITMAVKTKNQEPRIKIKDQNLEIKKVIQNSWQNYKKFLASCELDKALREIWGLISFCDRYIEKKRPWEKSKNRLSVINDLLIILTNITQMLQPFLPETSEKIFKQLGARLNSQEWCFKVRKDKILFPRI